MPNKIDYYSDLIKLIQNYDKYGYNCIALSEIVRNVPTSLLAIIALYPSPQGGEIVFVVNNNQADPRGLTLEHVRYLKKGTDVEMPSRIIQSDTQVDFSLDDIARLCSELRVPLALFVFTKTIDTEEELTVFLSAASIDPRTAFELLKSAISTHHKNEISRLN